MLYLIGGAARNGKSRLATQLDSPHLLSGDSMRSALKPLLPVKAHLGYDTTNASQYIEYYSQHGDHATSELDTQAKNIMPFLARYAKARRHESTQPLIVEGIDIWPQYLDQIDVPYRVVFLIDTSSPLKQIARIKQYDSPNSWMKSRNLNPEQVSAWAVFNQQRSLTLLQQAKKWQKPYLDLANQDFSTLQLKALKQLLN